MLKESNENALSTLQFGVSHVGENGFNGFEVSGTSEFVEQSGIGRIIVAETLFLVTVKDRQGFFWVLHCFDLGDERNALAKLRSWPFMGSRFVAVE